MNLSKSQLQAALDSLASANNRAQKARNKIMEHSIVVYGVIPGDVDNDYFIDGVDSGCGATLGMTAEEFDKSMRKCMGMNGISMPKNEYTKAQPKKSIKPR